ncbi:flavodoxin [Lactobacillus amylovorus]|uniref:flavodoxin n=1 Tax=Lactobacillus amylovorus TaxID=1604 RepID=UPI00288B6023|nr:flavodoxin [Lactobacillus amylovorus]
MILTVTHTTIEQHQHQSRVVIQNDLSDISNYQNVIIAHPIWWGIPPRLIATLIDTLDLNGKKVATCATSGGTGYFRS